MPLQASSPQGRSIFDAGVTAPTFAESMVGPSTREENYGTVGIRKSTAR
jgi:hypothetical protein